MAGLVTNESFIVQGVGLLRPVTHDFLKRHLNHRLRQLTLSPAGIADPWLLNVDVLQGDLINTAGVVLACHFVRHSLSVHIGGIFVELQKRQAEP